MNFLQVIFDLFRTEKDQSSLSYNIIVRRGGRHLPGLPDELEDCDEAGEAHPGEQHDEDAAHVGQTQLARLRFIVVVLKPLIAFQVDLDIIV